MDDDVYVRNVKMLLLETIYICLRIEAWFDSISVTNQVETLYAYLSKDRSLVQFNPNHLYPICLRTEAWFSSISVIDQVKTLYSYFSKDKNLVRFDPDHRPSGNLTFLF